MSKKWQRQSGWERHEETVDYLVQRLLKSKRYRCISTTVTYPQGQLDVYGDTITPHGLFIHYYEVKGHHTESNANNSVAQLWRWKRYMHKIYNIPLSHIKLISYAPNYVKRVL